MSLQVPAGGGGVPTQPHHLDSDEICIQETIGKFYIFFQKLVTLKSEIERLGDIDEHTRARVLDQLDDIEREYKDGQEWFMTREVQDVRVGVVGTERSLKTALVSLFVEGVLEMEGDEKDGRSKSKITVDGKCKLLLIREETGCPSNQLCQWADVLLLVFSYSDSDSLLQVGDFYRVFREVSQNAPVLLVGVKDEHSQSRTVKDSEVRKMTESLDRCSNFDATLSQQNTYNLFKHACRLAHSTPFHFLPSSSLSSCPIPSSPSQSSLSSNISPGHVRFNPSQQPPPSPSHVKRGTKRKTGFTFGSKQAAYNIPKLPETIGSGRPVPVKEGLISKKSAGGLRAEWKKKYLVLTLDELTYFPSLNDYMSISHGKTLSLQHITVKVPGKRASTSRSTTSVPLTNSMEMTDAGSQQNDQSDHSDSTSPTPPICHTPPPPSHPPPSLESSYEYTNPTTIHVTTASPRIQRRDDRSPMTPDLDLDDEFSSLDTLDDLSRLHGFHYDQVLNNGHGHNRNSSMDENLIMQQLRTGGISYPPQEDLGERSATMSRIQVKKAKEAAGRGRLRAMLPGSEELLSEGTTGSSESLGKLDKPDKRSKKDRNSMVMERTNSESAKDREKKGAGKNHRRQKSWAGNKLLEVDPSDPAMETCEFQVLSLDGKVWSFEAGSPEEALSWVTSVEDQIKKMLSESISHKRMNSSTDSEKREIYSLEGNNVCADCNSPNPEWGSVNHGCLLCIECSGVHRKLGSHISRVRSLSLDEWSAELIAVMMALGNRVSRSIWEAKKPRTRPNYSAPREERERFIRAKYIDKEFIADLHPTGKSITERLMDTVQDNSVVGCLTVLAHATPDDINHLHGYCSPLHMACSLGRTIIVQLLIWNGADVNLLDADKRSPLFYARSGGHQDIITVLLTNSCQDDSHSPLSSDTGSTELLQSTAM